MVWTQENFPKAGGNGKRSDITRVVIQRLYEFEKVQRRPDGSVIEVAKTAERRQNIEALVDTLYELALIDKELPAIQEIWNRVEGRVPQRITGPDDGPIQVHATLSREELVLQVLNAGVDLARLPASIDASEAEVIDAETKAP